MGLYTMDSLEIAGGWVNGYDAVPPPAGPHESPRQVLDRLLLPHLRRSPCLVAFSGGRDSSVLLAAAVAVARREELPPPVPLTLSYPDAADSEEARWQRIVLNHLGIDDRIVLTVHDEHDPLGPVATPVLLRHGLVWPPNFAPTVRMMGILGAARPPRQQHRGNACRKQQRPSCRATPPSPRTAGPARAGARVPAPSRTPATRT